MFFQTSQGDLGILISDDMLNEDLELTPQAEIRQLKRVIAEKDRTIKAFREYDRKRSEEYNRMVENYKLMEEQFEQFCEDIREFDEIDTKTASDFIELFHRYYNKMLSADKVDDTLTALKNELKALNGTVAMLKVEINTLDKAADGMKEKLRKYKNYIDNDRKNERTEETSTKAEPHQVL